MNLTLEQKKQIASLAYQGYSVLRINDSLNIPCFIIDDFIQQKEDGAQ